MCINFDNMRKHSDSKYRSISLLRVFLFMNGWCLSFCYGSYLGVKSIIHLFEEEDVFYINIKTNETKTKQYYQIFIIWE